MRQMSLGSIPLNFSTGSPDHTMRARIASLAVFFLVAGFVLARPALRSAGHSNANIDRTESHVGPLQAGAATVDDGRAVIDIEPGSHQILVLACLAEPGILHRVSLGVQDRPSGQSRSLKPLSQFRTAASSETVRLTPPALQSTVADSSKTVTFPTAGSTARSFWLHVTDGSLDDEKQYVQVRAVPVDEGAFVRVYRDVSVSPSRELRRTVSEIVRLMDEQVIPQTAQTLGMYRDVDGDQKFAVLLTPWLGRLRGGRVSLGGFVRASDFRASVVAPFGNQCDMLYLNASLSQGPALEDLLHHEYTHAVCISARTGGTSWYPNEEDWLSEAIAHTSERAGTNLDHRLSRFLNAPERFPLVVDDYYTSGLWRNHGCRGATFLFLRWCCDRFGEQLLARLIRGRGRGVVNLEAATRCRFEDLFRAWTVELARAGEPESGTIGRIELCGHTSEWGLAGPRRIVWDLDDGDRACEIAGTAAAYVVLRAPKDGRVRRIRITATPGSRLQVTRVPITAVSCNAGIDADWTLSTDAARQEQVFNIAFDDESEMTPTYLAIEQHERPEPTSVCLRGEELQAMCQSDADDRRVYQIRLPLRKFRRDLPVIVKFARRRADGSQVSARTTLSCQDSDAIRVRPRSVVASESTP